VVSDCRSSRHSQSAGATNPSAVRDWVHGAERAADADAVDDDIQPMMFIPDVQGVQDAEWGLVRRVRMCRERLQTLDTCVGAAEVNESRGEEALKTSRLLYGARGSGMCTRSGSREDVWPKSKGQSREPKAFVR
jgi:hypothetical protein